ncbi:GDSL lipase/esterase, partial [Dillenia turbinata]
MILCYLKGVANRGYLEDRRPDSSMDPCVVTSLLDEMTILWEPTLEAEALAAQKLALNARGKFVIVTKLDAFDMPFLNPYLDSVGAPTFQTGCNFATGGSTIHPANPASLSPFSFGTQVNQFGRFKARVLDLLARDNRMQKFLPSAERFKKGLYMFDVGQNDIDGAFYSKSEDQVIASVPDFLLEFENGIERLYYGGARNFWIHNMGPLGCLPRIIATYGKDASKLDQIGCVISHNNAAKVFNTQLQALCTKFQGQFPDTNATYIDIFSIKLDLIANYSQYGFKQPLAACCGYGGSPLNFDNRISCGATKNLNGTKVTAKPCDNATEYVNWDGNHYTEAANLHVSAKMLTGEYSNPKMSKKMPFLVKSKSYRPRI